MFFISILFKYILPIALFYLLGIYFIRMTLKKILWYCAGANVELLEKCPNDYSRYQNIGATIIMTALLAWISMGFALHSVFNSFLASILVGFVWACMIFILDRTIVTSMQKPIRNNIQSQGVTIWGVQGSGLAKFGDNFREIGFTLIRIVIAILISLVITKPLEIKIFEKRLHPVINNMGGEQAQIDSVNILREFQIPILTQEVSDLKTAIVSLEQQIAKIPKSALYLQLEERLKSCRSEVAQFRSQKQGEINQHLAAIGKIKRDWAEPRPTQEERKLASHRGQISRINGDINSKDIPCKEIEKGMRNELARYNKELTDKLASKKSDLENKEKQLEAAQEKFKEEWERRKGGRDIAFSDNIITQIQALEVLKSKDDAMKWTSRLIMLMFIIIETAPVLAKLFSKRGQYDDAFEEAEIAKWIDLQKIKAEQIQDMNVSLSAKEVISKTNIQELEAKAQRDALANENSHNQDTAHKLALQAAKHTKAYNEELSNYEKLVNNIAEAQRKIALEQVEIWKNEQLEILKKKSNNNNPPTI